MMKKLESGTYVNTNRIDSISIKETYHQDVMSYDVVVVMSGYTSIAASFKYGYSQNYNRKSAANAAAEYLDKLIDELEKGI